MTTRPSTPAPPAPSSPDVHVGLSIGQVEARRRQFGPNEVPDKKPRAILTFLSKFWGLSAWMLEAIAALSWMLHRYADLVIAASLLALNAVIGFFQERRAEGVVDTLRRRLQVNARVLRDGQWQMLPARDLVPDDVVRIRQGDVVPADIRLLGGTLSVDQSVLTGESQDAEKAADATLYSGSVIRRGEATGLVTATGARTYFGRTTELVQIARPTLHAEALVSYLVRWLFVIVGGVVLVIVGLAIARGIPLVDVLPLLLALLLGAVPVALPVMLTVSMAVGARELAADGVLVTRLSATEDAAAMDVLCVDKTGTITANRLAVARVIPLSGFNEGDVLLHAAYASETANQDPIDLAIFAAAHDHATTTSEATVLSFVPFDAARRRTEAVVQVGGRRMRVVKGAVDVVATVCGLDAAATAALDARARDEAERGYRTLAVARGFDPSAPEPVGLLCLYDPPRADAAALITALRGLGVAIKMLTGDALPVATEVARQVGLRKIAAASKAGTAAHDLVDPAADIDAVDGLAEVYPEDKYKVVKHLQAAGHVVGMTGDGVNDAPALRQAEVGIAVTSAADVAKGAASVVLTREGLSGIVTLVHEGRIVYQRVLTWIINKVSRTILKSAFVAIAFLVTGRLVMSALGIIVLVFLTDFVKITLSTDHVEGSPRPETWDMRTPVLVGAAIGVLMVVETLAVLWAGWRLFDLGTQEPVLQTFSFQMLFYFALFSIVSARERRPFWASRPSGVLIAALCLDGVAGTALSAAGIPGLTPVPWHQTVFVLIAAMTCSLGINDFVKTALLRRTGLG
jgi:plasma-membrane proton-efflux P-type ATPase